MIYSQDFGSEELKAVSEKAGEVGRDEKEAGLHAAPREEARRCAGLSKRPQPQRRSTSKGLVRALSPS